MKNTTQTTRRLELLGSIIARNVDGMYTLQDYSRMIGLAKTIAKATDLEIEDVLRIAGLN